MTPEIERELREGLERALKLGFDGYCTDCESAAFVRNGRCGCGSGRVVTPASLLTSRSRGNEDG